MMIRDNMRGDLECAEGFTWDAAGEARLDVAPRQCVKSPECKLSENRPLSALSIIVNILSWNVGVRKWAQVACFTRRRHEQNAKI